MPIKIFVGNVNSDATKEELEELFTQYGHITECTILNNFAFVHLEDEEGVTAAITDLNGALFAGQPLTVQRAKSGANTKGGKFPFVNSGPVRRMKGGIPERIGLTKIFVGNIKDGTVDADLRALFEAYGEVTEADICGGFGFVHMPKQNEALKAINELKGYTMNGNKLNIELSTTNTQGRSKVQADDLGYDEDYEPWGVDFREQMRPPMGRGARYAPYKLQAPPRKMGPRGVGSGMRGGLFGVDFNSPRFPVLPRGGLMPPPRMPKNPPQASNDNFARELLDLYLRNPDAFDRYARDPNVQRSLNLTHYLDEENVESDQMQEDASDISEHFYRPPIEYYDNKSLINTPLETQPVMYPNLPPPSVLKSGPPMRPPRPPLPRSRFPGPPNPGYISFE